MDCCMSQCIKPLYQINRKNANPPSPSPSLPSRSILSTMMHRRCRPYGRLVIFIAHALHVRAHIDFNLWLPNLSGHYRQLCKWAVASFRLIVSASSARRPRERARASVVDWHALKRYFRSTETQQITTYNDFRAEQKRGQINTSKCGGGEGEREQWRVIKLHTHTDTHGSKR